MFRSGPKRKRRSVCEKRSRLRWDGYEVAKNSVRVFGSHNPTPSPAGDELKFRTCCGLFHFKSRKQMDRRHERVCQVPIFIPAVKINPIADGGIACKGRSEFGVDASFLIIPTCKRAPIQSVLAEIVEFRVDGQIRQASQEGKSALQFRAAPAVLLGSVDC